jgi:hypothetical protein
MRLGVIRDRRLVFHQGRASMECANLRRARKLAAFCPSPLPRGPRNGKHQGDSASFSFGQMRPALQQNSSGKPSIERNLNALEAVRVAELAEIA